MACRSSHPPPSPAPRLGGVFALGAPAADAAVTLRIGGGGPDTLLGGANDEVLIGGPGVDTLEAAPAPTS